MVWRITIIAGTDPVPPPPLWRSSGQVCGSSAGLGGDGEIRTRGKGYPLRQFSKLLVSATHPRLQRNWQAAAIARAVRAIN